MLVITALGSCRVTNPVRNAVSSYPITLNNARVYGYAHSSAELVQQIRFLKQQIELTDEVRPLLAPAVGLAIHDASMHRPSDLYIVEISSAKVVRYKEICVQWNHVCRHFAGFLQDPGRAKVFWSLASGDHDDEKQAFLAKDSRFQHLSRADQTLLRGLTLKLSDENALRADIERIRRELPKVLFVTHVNALLPDGGPIPSRNRFIRRLTEILTGCGADFHNPTELMTSVGQAVAMKKEAASLTHYTEIFETALFAAWYGIYQAKQAPMALAV